MMQMPFNRLATLVAIAAVVCTATAWGGDADHWKDNYYPERDAELYDLQNDPHEQHNLAAEPAQKPVVEEMKQRLLDWLITADEADQIAPRWVIP